MSTARNTLGSDVALPPGDRPLKAVTSSALARLFAEALASRDGLTGAQCVHELWMRGEMGMRVGVALERLWACAAESIPEWLPTRYVEWLPAVYEMAARCRPLARGRSHVYLVLLDYGDHNRGDPFGIYVGMSHYRPALRFEQHKAGIRAAGSVLRRGLELLAGPTLHLQEIARAEAARIEAQLAERLRAIGLHVEGGH